jgi:hypothetical protein
MILASRPGASILRSQKIRSEKTVRGEVGGGQHQRQRPIRVPQGELDRRRPTSRESEHGGALDL